MKKVVITEPDLRALVDEANEYLTENDAILPFDNYDPKDFKLTESEVDSLLKNNDNEDKGKIVGSLLNTYVQAHADSLLDKILNHKAIIKYDLSDILSMAVVISSDDKLFCLSYPANTGGTYQSNKSFIHYRPGNGSVINFNVDGGGISEGKNFNPDGFESIGMIPTPNGTKYLLYGNVVGCTTCIGEYIQLVHFENGEVFFDFSYSISSKSGGGLITYDKQHELITVEHDPEGDNDNHTDCDCNTDDVRAALTSNNSEIADVIDISGELKTAKSLKCIFYFNGDTFVLNRKKSRMPE
ncbi:hypothetical protein [Mucilaginibacter psychrotolerans]|uniref:Uncharacterized protein n=1 Tax=Mucilaginibacter psychrotolerans TaxID=1524096 RepID=A0A4Y8S9A7_9SPHI|nr:hypothetical protein [Mucilaginibacter psychrotolerans]TFF35200.1 hypothetical protein E2R66_19745 [Mucilaginibacter psychrotolerans]